MRILKYIFASLFVLAALSSCTGTVDENSLPILAVSDSEIDLASGETAVFTVTFNGVDVTDQSVIYCGGVAMEGSEFAPEAVGDYVFYAEYEGKISVEVSLAVIDTTPVVVESKYRRHVCVAEMTGAWCVNCPGGYNLMYEKLSIPSNKKYKENLHICAFHSDMEGFDTLAVAATQDIVRAYDLISLGYPSFVTDFRKTDEAVGNLTSDGIGEFIPSIKTSHDEYPAHCGVAVSSSLSADRKKADITVKLASELTSGYRMIVLVVQSRITGFQKTTMYPSGTPDYIHNHVVRKVVTGYESTFTGEKMSDSSVVKAEEEVSKTWTVDIPKEWVLENTEIYAIALDANGYANNMNVCAIDGGDSGYDLI